MDKIVKRDVQNFVNKEMSKIRSKNTAIKLYNKLVEEQTNLSIYAKALLESLESELRYIYNIKDDLYIFTNEGGYYKKYENNNAT